MPDDVADIDGNGFFDEPTPLDRSGLARFADDPATDDTGQGMAPVVDMGAHEFADACRADLDASGVVDVIDLVLLLANWGGSGAGDITSAIPGIPDGVVDTHDLLDVLAQWGSCA